MGCALNSDCAAGLTCTFGLCHSACVINGDCPAGQLCVESDTFGDGGKINVCQLPTELKCVYNSNCTSPLICARDQQCRNQCQMDVDCVSPQVCTTSKVCALTSQLAPGTNDVPVVTTGVGGAAGGSATGTGGAAGSTATGTGGSATGTGGASATGGAGAAGSTGTGGATGTGGTAGAKGTGGAAGGCATVCALGFQCVSGTCQPCGTAGNGCCGTGTTATCNSNLTCVSGTCTCGGSTQACCDGTTCSTGFQCTNGTCGCGASGQYCCAGTTKCTGSLVCGGRRCGCANSCDQSASLKNDGSIFISGTPVTNTNGTLFLATSVSNNPFITCALKADGTVWCWGSNTYGALGIGDTTIPSSKTPLQVSTAAASGSPLTGITSIVVADYGYNACAIGAGGALWCWGYGAYGELGIGDESNASFAVPVVADASGTPVTGFKSVSPSYYNTCGLKTDNTAWCWGDSYYGATGNGAPLMATNRYVPYPVQVTNLATNATSIIASYWNYNACASTIDGSAYCWGYNGYGDLANGLATGSSNVPSQVQVSSGIPLTMVSKVINWYGKPCAARTDGSIWCWPDAGSNYYAVQLKDSAANRVTGLSLSTVGRNCYLDTDDQVWVNGSTSTSYQVSCP